MKIVRDPVKLNRSLKVLRRAGRSIGFVPTMGALHEGHLSLIRQAKKENDAVVVSIFVNPKQFGPQEDLKKYPRPLKKDIALCRGQKADFIFLPDESVLYPQGFTTFVEVEGLSARLCGVSRPGHFRGVTTVVAKLLNIVGPSKIYLGQKDAQQALIIQRMVSDLNFPVTVVVSPTVRQSDGLALSSRNAYLSAAERAQALVLFKALSLARSMAAQGQDDAARILQRMKELILRKSRAKIDYVEIVDLEELKPVKRIKAQDCLVCLAVKIGKTRLIDNVIISKTERKKRI